MLPFGSLEDWGEGLGGAAARDDAERYAADRAQACDRMREILADPVVEESLYLASPELHARWQREGLVAGIELAMARYLSRMASRCTPFGLFAGTSVGAIGNGTRLALKPSTQGRRHTRLDTELLERLVHWTIEQPSSRSALRFVRNSSLTHIADRLHYAQSRTTATGRAYFLVEVEPHEPLLRGLQHARRPCTLDDLARAIAGDEISFGAARQFVDQLVDAQLVIPTLGPVLTGEGGLSHLVDELAHDAAAPTVLARLRALDDGLRTLDRAGPGAPIGVYTALSSQLDGIVDVRPDRFVQVDLVRSGERIEVEAGLVRELAAAALALVDLFGRSSEDPLAEFKRAFEARYEERTVPLVEALDDEIGIGLKSSSTVTADPSPLIAGLPFPAQVLPETIEWGSRGRFLLDKVLATVRAGTEELVLEPSELERFRSPDSPQLADSFHVLATVLDPDSEHAPRAVFDSAGGPSGARLLGRFCHADPELEQGVREHLRAEEALDPSVRYFEVVHLPEGRTGNILARPVLRDLELEFLGRSGAPEHQRLQVDDLLVTVSGGRVVLHSRSLGCEVRPRVTTAHDHRTRSLPLYRFLCDLQFEGRVAGVTWSWGPLDTLPRLPRVRLGRIVLARARWTLRTEEIESLRARGHEGFRRVQRLRDERGLPRWIGLVEQDNVLTIDLDHPLLVEAFLDALRGREFAVVQEHFPGARPDAASSPEGRFTNEIVVPFVRRSAAPRAQRAVEVLDDAAPHVFPPGSEWLAAKVYAGTVACDELLTEVLLPLTQESIELGLVDRWFFVRFGDPDWHLRVRWHGDGRRLCAELLPRLHAELADRIADRRVHRLQIDTYQRETRRYGGSTAIPVVEEIFWHDSEFVARFVTDRAGDDGLDVRWRVAALAMDRTMADAGMDIAARHGLTARLASSFAEEFGADSPFRAKLRERFRAERASLESLLFGTVQSAEWAVTAHDRLRERSLRVADAFSRLRAIESTGGLCTGREEIVASLLHMHANRILRGAHRAQESVLHRFLERTYASRLARSRGAES